MNRSLLALALVLSSSIASLTGCAAGGSSQSAYASAKKPDPRAEWHMNATIIEACSCPMFCQCYFNSEPAGPGCCATPDDPTTAKRFCRFNNAFRVNDGVHKGTSLDGAKFWLAGNLGGDFTKSQMDWCVLHFDPSVSAAQREGIAAILPHVYPVKWNSFSVGADLPIEWSATRDRAHARMDQGRAAEVVLVKNKGMTDEPIVVHNLRYWGVPRNDGFVCMANEVEAFRIGEQPFEYKGTNGFMITFDIAATDIAAVN